MSMTREEAIKFAEHAVNMTDIPDVKEFYGLSAAALRGPTREMVERMRGEWVRHEGYDECASCSEKTIYGHNFCPHCGEPKTAAAVDMMLERWKEAVVGDN